MAISPPNKIKYLTNKDLLEEIHLSKSTYCSYVDPTHMRYDFIVSNVSMITKQRIDDARKKKLADMQAVEKKENGFVTPVALTKLTNASLKSLPSKVKKAGPVLSLYLEHRTRLRPVQSRSIANRAGLDLSPIRHETRKINMGGYAFREI